MDAVRLVWQLHVRRLQHKPDSGLPHICDARQQGVDSCHDKPAVQSGQPACTTGLMGSGPPPRQYDLLSETRCTMHSGVQGPVARSKVCEVMQLSACGKCTLSD